MLWYCRFVWQPGVSAQAVRERIVQQHDAGTNQPDKLRGWYNLAGGGAGFMLIEADEPREVTRIAPAIHGPRELGRARRLRAPVRPNNRRVSPIALSRRVVGAPGMAAARPDKSKESAECARRGPIERGLLTGDAPIDPPAAMALELLTARLGRHRREPPQGTTGAQERPSNSCFPQQTETTPRHEPSAPPEGSARAGSPRSRRASAALRRGGRHPRPLSPERGSERGGGRSRPPSRRLPRLPRAAGQGLHRPARVACRPRTRPHRRGPLGRALALPPLR